MNKIEIRAAVTVSAQDPKSGTRQVTVEYFSPPPLSGLKLTAGLDQNGDAVGNIQAEYRPATPSEAEENDSQKPILLTQEPLILTLERDSAAELLRPARVLIPQQPYTEILRLEEGFRITFPDGRVMETDGFGRPKQVFSEQFHFQIIFWN